MAKLNTGNTSTVWFKPMSGHVEYKAYDAQGGLIGLVEISCDVRSKEAEVRGILDKLGEVLNIENFSEKI